MRLLPFALIGLALALAPGSAASAQEWPDRPVTMIVPFPAGGPADIIARAVANALSESPRQAIHHRQSGGSGRQYRRRCRRQGSG